MHKLHDPKHRRPAASAVLKTWELKKSKTLLFASYMKHAFVEASIWKSGNMWEAAHAFDPRKNVGTLFLKWKASCAPNIDQADSFQCDVMLNQAPFVWIEGARSSCKPSIKNNFYASAEAQKRENALRGLKTLFALTRKNHNDRRCKEQELDE